MTQAPEYRGQLHPRLSWPSSAVTSHLSPSPGHQYTTRMPQKEHECVSETGVFPSLDCVSGILCLSHYVTEISHLYSLRDFWRQFSLCRTAAHSDCCVFAPCTIFLLTYLLKHDREMLKQQYVVVSTLALFNEVNLRRTRLVLRWVTVSGSIPSAGHLFQYVTNQPSKANSAFHPSGIGKWVPASAGKAKAGMVHSVSGWTRGVQVKLWDPLRTRAIPERLVFTTRH